MDFIKKFLEKAGDGWLANDVKRLVDTQSSPWELALASGMIFRLADFGGADVIVDVLSGQSPSLMTAPRAWANQVDSDFVKEICESMISELEYLRDEIDDPISSDEGIYYLARDRDDLECVWSLFGHRLPEYVRGMVEHVDKLGEELRAKGAWQVPANNPRLVSAACVSPDGWWTPG